MNDNPLTGDVNPREIMALMRNPSRLESLLTSDVGPGDATPAEILADIVTVMRADCKQLADAHGVDMEIVAMSDERAAELIAGLTDGDVLELVEVFNDVAHKRHLVLEAVLDEGDYRTFREEKASAMYTSDPEIWTEGEDEEGDDGGD